MIRGGPALGWLTPSLSPISLTFHVVFDKMLSNNRFSLKPVIGTSAHRLGNPLFATAVYAWYQFTHVLLFHKFKLLILDVMCIVELVYNRQYPIRNQRLMVSDVPTNFFNVLSQLGEFK